ncbi:hypothetical protein J2N86_15025 (plasmid) [Legionella lytica]|uniref:Uncharacterized protein n=1 Tax=Legionella lytica TaxID=96232 RepID=A0ABY4YCV3_9GAMM|nr:hypothetical protein [Legionella lytica]USQ15272.1 hypothetical protein J2N86_15025 [Legionella lytica]
MSIKGVTKSHIISFKRFNECFSHTRDLLFNPHQDQTIQRIHEEDAEHIYVIQDSTFYNYTNHSAKIDMGVIGKQGRFTQLGLLQHTALCISQDEKPLGIIALDFIGYDAKGNHILAKEKLSSFWIKKL